MGSRIMYLKHFSLTSLSGDQKIGKQLALEIERHFMMVTLSAAFWKSQ